MTMITSEDLKQLKKIGISKEALDYQLDFFKNGHSYLTIVSPALANNGIIVLDESAQQKYEDIYELFTGESVKFVPASGAATRMFKDLFELQASLENNNHISNIGENFFNNLERFPFYDDLNKFLLVSASNKKTILDYLLLENGMNYGNLPKGLIKFHKYVNCVRSAFEEHLTEAGNYLLPSEGVLKLHFTVSKEHLKAFIDKAAEVKCEYENRFFREFEITFSVQKPSTDTIAADKDFNPMRKPDGTLLFRPGGHGALIDNLNDTEGDIIFIKNVDNVSKESLLPETVKWKRVLAGKLIEIQNSIFGFLERLDGEKDDLLNSEIIEFLNNELSISIPNIPEPILRDFLRAKLDRPIRVCGMVKNSGEPGGGPYVIRDADGSTSLQILEKAQINPAVKEYQSFLERSTHFNPVDIACSIKRYNGEVFDLARFIDPSTAFISEKSSKGEKLYALELPGLWNGAMSQWNTLFVEVPVITFNPVKTLFDLLRPEHQE